MLQSIDRGHIIVHDKVFEARDVSERFIRFAPIEGPIAGHLLCAGYDIMTTDRGGMPGRGYATWLLARQERLHEAWRPHQLLFLGTRWRIAGESGERISSLRFTGGAWSEQIVSTDDTFSSAYKVAVYIRP